MLDAKYEKGEPTTIRALLAEVSQVLQDDTEVEGKGAVAYEFIFAGDDSLRICGKEDSP